MCLETTLTKTYYVALDYDTHSDTFQTLCLVKSRGGLYYWIATHKVEPEIGMVVNKARHMRCFSKRPYSLEQRCDASVTAPVFYLYHQFCQEAGLNAKDLYNQVYGEDVLTVYELEKCLLLAEWQGVKIISEWNDATFRLLYRRLRDVRLHLLADALFEIISRKTVLEPLR